MTFSRQPAASGSFPALPARQLVANLSEGRPIRRPGEIRLLITGLIFDSGRSRKSKDKYPQSLEREKLLFSPPLAGAKRLITAHIYSSPIQQRPGSFKPQALGVVGVGVGVVVGGSIVPRQGVGELASMARSSQREPGW